MNESLWDTLFKAIYRPLSDPNQPVPKPTEMDLDKCEQELHCRLPFAYRSFIKMFGPGGFVYQFQEQCSILAPDCLGDPDFDLVQFNQEFRRSLSNSSVSQRSYVDLAMIERLVFFGISIYNNYYAWDPTDISDQATFEMPVYQLLREGQRATIIAPTFVEFVEQCCGKYRIADPNDTASLATHCSYLPAQLTPQGRRLLTIRQNRSTHGQKSQPSPKKRPKK